MQNDLIHFFFLEQIQANPTVLNASCLLAGDQLAPFFEQIEGVFL